MCLQHVRRVTILLLNEITLVIYPRLAAYIGFTVQIRFLPRLLHPLRVHVSCARICAIWKENIVYDFPLYKNSIHFFYIPLVAQE